MLLRLWIILFAEKSGKSKKSFVSNSVSSCKYNLSAHHTICKWLFYTTFHHLINNSITPCAGFAMSSKLSFQNIITTALCTNFITTTHTSHSALNQKCHPNQSPSHFHLCWTRLLFWVRRWNSLFHLHFHLTTFPLFTLAPVAILSNGHYWLHHKGYNGGDIIIVVIHHLDDNNPC